MSNIDKIVSDSVKALPVSYVGDILKAAANPGMISFAGGLPHPLSFPQEALLASMKNIVEKYQDKCFQYSGVQGIPELRQFIVERYKNKYGIDITIDDVLITTGSQQALDLIGKALTNKGDGVVVEKPTYMAAIQIFSQYQPKFHAIELEEDGINLDQLKAAIADGVKYIYLIPNFQNPTGLTYSKEKRDAVYELIKDTDIVLVEDDPYGEIRYEGEPAPYIGCGRYENGIVLGTFSKTATPGMRLGFIICKNKELMGALAAVKELADLHTNVFSQYLIYDYVSNNDYDAHIEKIKAMYKKNAYTMIDAMEKYFPKEVSFTKPIGGMFLWLTFPDHIKALELAPKAIERGVIFVPGDAFYVDFPGGANTARLNYTNATEEKIEEGIKILGDLLKELV